jgi:hypothetical protein
MQRLQREAQLREEKIKSVELKAQNDLKKFRPVTDTTPYLTGKEIPPLGDDIRQGYDWDGTPFLAIPAYKYSGKGKPKKPAKKKLVGYQRIYDNSDKKNQYGFSPSGAFFQLGEAPPLARGSRNQCDRKLLHLRISASRIRGKTTGVLCIQLRKPARACQIKK